MLVLPTVISLNNFFFESINMHFWIFQIYLKTSHENILIIEKYKLEAFWKKIWLWNIYHILRICILKLQAKLNIKKPYCFWYICIIWIFCLTQNNGKNIKACWPNWKTFYIWFIFSSVSVSSRLNIPLYCTRNTRCIYPNNVDCTLLLL